VVESARPSSPMDEFPDEPHRRRRWPRVLAIVAAVVVVLAGAYVGALWLWAERVAPGTTVAGVELGGMQADEAEAALTDSLAAATTEELPVAAGDNRTTVDPVAAGLTLDAPATVDALTGFDLQPRRLWEQLFGAGEADPVTRVDEDALAEAVEGVSTALSVDPVDGTVLYVDGAPQGTEAVAGSAVDADAAAEVIRDGWLTEARPLELPTEVTEPAISQEEVDRVLAEVARPFVAAPVTVAVADQLAELPPDVLAGAASFAPDGSELVLRLDGAALVEAVTARTTALLTSPSDGSFEFQGGVPVIVPGTPGTTLDPTALADAVATAGTGADRTARVELVEVAPTESTAELEALGIVEVVSEFSTPLNSEPRRTQNITNGASKINGTLVRPGETFSLTEALGPIDGAHGFVQAGAIVNGEHSDAWGGGLSQLSTTTYNAAFFAGFEDVEHHPHSEWFSRYPEGREATIFTGSLDMRWKNTTPYGALVQAWVEGGRTHVRIWGTKYWEVQESTSGRSGVVSPTTVYSQSPTCEAQSAGNPGFTVTVTRRLLLQGVEQSSESWTVRYKPQNHVVCGPPPAG
jgi:vancomycin resistance protein YoaR